MTKITLLFTGFSLTSRDVYPPIRVCYLVVTCIGAKRLEQTSQLNSVTTMEYKFRTRASGGSSQPFVGVLGATREYAPEFGTLYG